MVASVSMPIKWPVRARSKPLTTDKTVVSAMTPMAMLNTDAKAMKEINRLRPSALT